MYSVSFSDVSDPCDPGTVGVAEGRAAPVGSVLIYFYCEKLQFVCRQYEGQTVFTLCGCQDPQTDRLPRFGPLGHTTIFTNPQTNRRSLKLLRSETVFTLR